MIYLKTSIGIELEGDDMTLSSLQGNISGGTLSQFKRISDYRNRDSEELRQEIQHFLKNNVLAKDNIVVGIPRRDVLLRHLDLPAEVADNLKQVVQYQVQSFEPTDEDSFYYDYVQLGKNQKNKRISILLAMVRKSLLDDHLQRLFDLGIQPAAITCSSLALCNLFLQDRKNDRDKTYILANVAPESLELIVLQNGIPLYSNETAKTESIGWKDLILKEAGEATSRIRLGEENTIEEFVLAGEASETAYAELKEALPECSLLNETVKISSKDENKQYIQKSASSVGLAFTAMDRHPAFKINLIPPAFRFKQTRWAYISAAILGLVIIALLAGLLFHRQLQDRKLAGELDLEIESRKPAVEKVIELRKETEALAKEITFMENLFHKQDRNLEVLQELTQRLPDDTYLYSYTCNNGKVTINGYSNSASDLVLILQSSPLFKDVEPKGSTTRDQRSGKERFQIEANLEE